METVNNSQKTALLAHYTTYDNQPNEGENIYHIKLVQLDGSIRFSDNKTVLFYKTDNIAVFPNPTEAEINISFKGYAGQSADITVYDMQGKSLFTQHIDNVQTSVHTLDIGEKASAGQYMMRVKMTGKKDVVRHFTLSK
jgi:Secretion system C-terminal sorting domain